MAAKKNKPASNPRPKIHQSEKAKPTKPAKSKGGKRSNVADARDRYANQEVSF